MKRTDVLNIKLQDFLQLFYCQQFFMNEKKKILI
jgi:hypothetical protein